MAPHNWEKEPILEVMRLNLELRGGGCKADMGWQETEGPGGNGQFLKRAIFLDNNNG